MSQEGRVKRLEGRVRADGRYFVLRESWARDGTFHVWPGGQVMTRQAFDAEYEPTDQDTVLEVVYVENWRGGLPEGGDR